MEVKSSLGVNDINELIEDLTEFRTFFPEYSQKQLYGAVAGIEIEEGADKYAYRQGLFVLAQAGETVSILNNSDFQPKIGDYLFKGKRTIKNLLHGIGTIYR